MKKPSKKIIALIIIALAAIGSSVIAKFYKPSPKEELVVQPLSYEISGTPSLNDYEDSDDDGLKDWEELLWGTDKNNKDSDKDGTEDGKEIKDGRNPIVSGPNDKIKSSGEVATSTENLTKSDIISRELFSKYINLSESGDTSVESRERLVAEIVEKSKDSFTFPVTTLKDLRILYSPGKTDIEFYASSVAAIQINLLLKISEQSATNPDVLKLKTIYESASKSLRDVPTPNDVVYSHLGMINNYNITASMYSALQNYQKDPVTFAIALRSYQEAAQTQLSNVESIAKFIRDNGIIFPDGNIGNYWNNF